MKEKKESVNEENGSLASDVVETKPTSGVSAALPSDALAFRVKTRLVEYGDKRKFSEYQILMYQGSRLVGMEEGPRRETPSRPESLKAARVRIRQLKAHRLFVVQVTSTHIRDGEGRNCNTCAISQALWHNQERMGFSKYEYNFEVSPYAAFVEARGLVLNPKWRDEEELHIPEDSLPEMVIGMRGKRIFHESMIEWAMEFDD